jgi:hypothetical protein
LGDPVGVGPEIALQSCALAGRYDPKVLRETLDLPIGVSDGNEKDCLLFATGSCLEREYI